MNDLTPLYAAILGGIAVKVFEYVTTGQARRLSNAKVSDDQTDRWREAALDASEKLMTMHDELAVTKEALDECERARKRRR